MSKLTDAILKARTIGISGHRRPDGDCAGACLGLYNYMKDVYPDKKVAVYLEPIKKEYRFLRYSDAICQKLTGKKELDLFFALDCAEEGRLGDFAACSKNAKKVFCVDHHISNQGFGEERIIIPDASSTCEILFEQLEYEKISKYCAEALYMGIVHDTGVFKYTNTSQRTMEIAGALIAKGIHSSHIIEDTFYRKSYAQNQILGRALIESIQLLGGKILFSVISRPMLKFYGVNGADLDGIIDQLRMTEGTECAILIYEIGLHKYKVSLRSNDYVDVSKVASSFGGGGHIRAAGCTMSGLPRDVINNLALPIATQMKEAGLIGEEELS